jgi:hypothetical protein
MDVRENIIRQEERAHKVHNSVKRDKLTEQRFGKSCRTGEVSMSRLKLRLCAMGASCEWTATEHSHS